MELHSVSGNIYKRLKWINIYDYNAEVILHEGKYHQVKRMFAYFGYTVVDLHRSEFAFLNLEGLEEADYRPLTNEEIEMLKECANKGTIKKLD